jgi:pimeloyl-ACP methyl ester carboxylesterase
MFVQWEAPVEVSHPFPVVLVHGGGGQGTNYLDTPDGRPGWATQLVQEGYEVYVVDRPGHGRAPFHPAVLGPMSDMFPYAAALALFRPPPDGPLSHPTSHLHTQWPGTGDDDDPVLEAFLASSGPMLADAAAAHRLERERGAQLLDRIGPAIVVTHSAGGPAGWQWTDARPELVKAHVAIEVVGPPFTQNPDTGISLDWGLTAAPLTYDPPAGDPSELKRVVHSGAEGSVPMTLQAEPARRLSNISAAPIAVLTGEASLFAQFDDHLVAFLEQAGCDVDRLRLADHGVYGNSHGMMFELNNREVLQVVLEWLEARQLTSAAGSGPSVVRSVQ